MALPIQDNDVTSSKQTTLALPNDGAHCSCGSNISVTDSVCFCAARDDDVPSRDASYGHSKCDEQKHSSSLTPPSSIDTREASSAGTTSCSQARSHKLIVLGSSAMTLIPVSSDRSARCATMRPPFSERTIPRTLPGLNRVATEDPSSSCHLPAITFATPVSPSRESDSCHSRDRIPLTCSHANCPETIRYSGKDEVPELHSNRYAASQPSVHCTCWTHSGSSVTHDQASSISR